MYIEERGKSLLLRWSYEGKKYSFSMRGYNHLVGLSQAKAKLSQIETDILAGYFDPTLLKYKLQTTGKKPTKISAVEVFQQYASDRDRDRELSYSSRVRLKGIVSKLAQFLGDKPADKVTDAVARDVVARWSKSVSNRTIKGYLFDLRAAWDWAKGRYHLTDTNPWTACIDRIKKVDSPKQSKPFTITELKAIIAAFQSHASYSHYTDFVIFLSHSACRFGEVAGLRWKHLGSDFSTAWIGESISRGHQNKKGTKTGKARTIQLSPTVRAMLADRSARLDPQPEDLVFASPKGLAIDDHRFRARAWTTILNSCHIGYRSPYTLRHSAISHALKNGANYIALAEQTGHDKRVMLSTYAHAIDRECLFVDFGGK